MINNLNILLPEVFLSLSIFASLMLGVFIKKSYNLITQVSSIILIITVFISLICQAGDIFVSFLKRKINIKDISNILPGHGGILDRIDGLIFVLIFCFTLKLFEIF